MRSAPLVLLFDLLGTFVFTLNGATIAVLVPPGSLAGLPVGLLAAAVCFLIRLAGLRFGWHAPVARARREETS